ncbi:FRG domain-containing protein [Litorilituus sediminis]|uniref:FRG domain-containing protein n=1 Tax=Litorilituus sediminis TaxID=718192 RepID=A0A4P6P6Y0_9GAMM|nr:FRG domain-containing protein [Litorilituus sediminis]QBG35959.1 FRG domain-containing protein [Litorilituus sediminis]
MSEAARVTKLSTFIGHITDIKADENRTLFFRGHADLEYVALPTIFRVNPNDEQSLRYVEKEQELFHDIIMRCPEEFLSCNSAFDHLVKMQHYGLPTRLLDITSNPLVALYFACCTLAGKGAKGKDGEVLIYSIPNDEIKFYNSDTVSVVSNLSKMNSDFNFENVNHHKSYLHAIREEKPYFADEIKQEHLNSVLCVKPKLDNRRIVKQSGAFLLFGMGVRKNDPTGIPENYRSESIKKIEIPKSAKLNILNELKNVAISEATLFPEIDYVARSLRA